MDRVEISGVEKKRRRKKILSPQIEDRPRCSSASGKIRGGSLLRGKDVSAVYNRACFSITREKTRNLYQRNERARGCGANTGVLRIVNVPSRINSANFQDD